MKLMIGIGIFVMSILGSWLGSLLDNGNFLGGWSILLGIVGSFVGIWVGYRAGQYFGV